MIRKIAICDDDSDIAEEIRELLEKFYGKHTLSIDYYRDGSELEQVIKERDYDLYLLDVEMPKRNGIELKDMLGELEKEGAIIFITSHDDFIREAFGKNVYGYLGKPVSQYTEQLYKILKKIDAVCVDESILIEEKNGTQKRITIRNIRYLKAERCYTNICMDSGEKILRRKSLEQWEKELESIGFIRIHKSYIVNLRYIKRIGSKIILTSGEEIPVTRDKIKRTEVERRFMKYKQNSKRLI